MGWMTNRLWHLDDILRSTEEAVQGRLHCPHLKLPTERGTQIINYSCISNHFQTKGSSYDEVIVSNIDVYEEN